MPLKSDLRTQIIRTTSVLSDISVLPQNSKITILKIRHGKADDWKFQRSLQFHKMVAIEFRQAEEHFL